MRNYKSTTLTAALLLSSSLASAADLPQRFAPPAFVAPAPIFTWTGFYAGVNAGAAFGDKGRSDSADLPLNSVKGSLGTDGTLLFGDGRNNRVGFTGGGQVGYNYQLQPGSGFVVGIEADIQYVDLGSKNSGPSTDYTFVPNHPFGPPALGLAFAPPGAAVVHTGARSLDYFGTVRGRLGYAFNRFLAYGTGGFAYGGGGSDMGYAAGGGLEYAFTDRVSVKVEGLYVNLRGNGSGGTTAAYDLASNVLTVNDRRNKNEFEVARVGLNYKF